MVKIRLRNMLLAGAAALSLALAVPGAASADSVHVCQGGHNTCSTGGGGGGTTRTLLCANSAGGTIVVQANVCPSDFPILVSILS